MRLQHVAITAHPGAGDQVRAFYGELLELEERDVPPFLDASSLVWFRLGGDLELHVMLVAEPPRARPHFCLAVDGDLGELRSRLESHGIETADAPRIVGRPRFTCLDPFGNLVEFCRMDS